MSTARTSLGNVEAGDFVSLVPIVGVFLAWYLAARALANPLLLPSPVTVLQSAWEMTVTTGTLWRHLFATLYRVFAGFGVAIVVGVPLGLLMGTRDWADFLFDPVLSFGYPIPKVAFYPLLLIVFGLGSTSKILLVFMECLVPIVLGSYHGVSEVKRLYVWSAENLGASDRRVFQDVMLPASLPYIFSGLRTALPIAFIVAIVTELISSTEGIGYVIAYNAGSFALDKMFVGIFAAGLVGYLFDRLLGLIRARLLFWAESVDLDI